MGIDPVTHRPRTDLNLLANLPQLLVAANLSNSLMMNNTSTINGIPSTLEDTLRLIDSDPTQLAKIHILHNMLQVLSQTSSNDTPSVCAQITNLLCNSTLPFQNRLNHNNDLITGALSQLPGSLVSSGFETPDIIQQFGSKNVCQSSSNDDKEIGGEFLTADSLMPGLVPASPDHCSSKLINRKVDCTIMSSNPSSATAATADPFEIAVGNWSSDLIDVPAHSYWTDIIE